MTIAIWRLEVMFSSQLIRVETCPTITTRNNNKVLRQNILKWQFQAKLVFNWKWYTWMYYIQWSKSIWGSLTEFERLLLLIFTCGSVNTVLWPPNCLYTVLLCAIAGSKWQGFVASLCNFSFRRTWPSGGGCGWGRCRRLLRRFFSWWWPWCCGDGRSEVTSTSPSCLLGVWPDLAFLGNFFVLDRHSLVLGSVLFSFVLLLRLAFPIRRPAILTPFFCFGSMTLLIIPLAMESSCSPSISSQTDQGRLAVLSGVGGRIGPRTFVLDEVVSSE